MTGLQIGGVARQLGVSVDTIRYYERAGLLASPQRTGGNYRLYGAEQVEQLAFILNCRSLDMTHDEIRRLIALRHKPPKDCTAVNVLIDEHIAHIEERILELRRLSQRLHELRMSCNGVSTLDHCSIIGSLSRGSGSPLREPSTHLATHRPSAGKRRAR
jgi:Cd(II)/Pb(II)-responsive transcriptional regulator